MVVGVVGVEVYGGCDGGAGSDFISFAIFARNVPITKSILGGLLA